MVLKNILRHYIRGVNWKLLYQIGACFIGSLKCFSNEEKVREFSLSIKIYQQKVFDASLCRHHILLKLFYLFKRTHKSRPLTLRCFLLQFRENFFVFSQ